MKSVIDSAGNIYGPFESVVVEEDHLHCGVAILPLVVLGAGWQVVDAIPRTYAAAELEGLKAAKDKEINEARIAANNTFFVHQGKQVACDALSRSDIDGTNGQVGNSGALPQGWPGGWKAMDGSIIQIATVADWKAFYASMWAQGATNFAKSQSLKAALAGATTPQAISAIAW